MSYSTYMTIHGWKHEDDDECKLDSVCKIFNTNFDIIQDAGYWSKTNDDYVSFTEFMKDKITREACHKINTYLFVFCNHDGETDKEVYQSFIEFAKILAYVNKNLLIEISSDVDTEYVNIISEYYGNLEIPKRTIECTRHKLKTQIAEYERKDKIQYHKDELEKLLSDEDTPQR